MTNPRRTSRRLTDPRPRNLRYRPMSADEQRYLKAIVRRMRNPDYATPYPRLIGVNAGPPKNRHGRVMTRDEQAESRIYLRALAESMLDEPYEPFQGPGRTAERRVTLAPLLTRKRRVTLAPLLERRKKAQTPSRLLADDIGTMLTRSVLDSEA